MQETRGSRISRWEGVEDEGSYRGKLCKRVDLLVVLEPGLDKC